MSCSFLFCVVEIVSWFNCYYACLLDMSTCLAAVLFQSHRKIMVLLAEMSDLWPAYHWFIKLKALIIQKLNPKHYLHTVEYIYIYIVYYLLVVCENKWMNMRDIGHNGQVGCCGFIDSQSVVYVKLLLSENLEKKITWKQCIFDKKKIHHKSRKKKKKLLIW